MQTSYSGFIWSAIQPLSYIQFPWRFLLFTAVFSSFLGGFIVAFLKKYLNKLVLFSLLAILMIATIYSIRNDFKPQSYLNLNDSFYTSKQDIQWRVSSMSYEYVPKGVATKISEKETTELAIGINDLPKESFKVLSGEMKVSEVFNKSQDKIFNVFVSKAGDFRLNTFSFPGWTALVDSKKVSYNDSNKLKLITLNLTKGNHKVEFIFKNTLPRTIGNIVSSITVLFFLVFGISILIKSKKI